MTANQEREEDFFARAATMGSAKLANNSSRGLGGWFRRAGTVDAPGGIRWANVAKAGAGAGAAGTAVWMMADPNSGEKIGGAANNLGGGIGGLFGGLLGGLGSGLFGSLLLPGGISCCSCLLLAIVMYMMNSQ